MRKNKVERELDECLKPTHNISHWGGLCSESEWEDIHRKYGNEQQAKMKRLFFNLTALQDEQKEIKTKLKDL